MILFLTDKCDRIQNVYIPLLNAPSDIDDVGKQLYHFVLGIMDIDNMIEKGDFSGLVVYDKNQIAKDTRSLSSRSCG